MKAKVIKTDIKTRYEFSQPIETALYLQEIDNKFYITDLGKFKHKISFINYLKLSGK